MKEKMMLIENIVKQGSLCYNVSKTYLIVKRVFDIFVSLLGLILLSPVLVITALAIIVDSRGPVVFGQERCGLKGKTFKMYIFRSTAIKRGNPRKRNRWINKFTNKIYGFKDTCALTRVGKFIRKFGIDKLPQFFNILKGDMSFVGPRAAIISELACSDTWYNLRMSVKPGITGLWGVKKGGGTSFDEMVRLDMKYIRERSILYDLRIMLKSIPVFIRKFTAALKDDGTYGWS